MARDPRRTVTLRLSDHGILNRLPTPIALAWDRVHAAGTPTERLRRAEACAEIIARTLVALLLPDYLRGARSERMEQLIPWLAKPSDGVWVEALRALAAHLRQRREPAPFMPEAGDWLDGGGGDEPGLVRSLLDLPWLRNLDIHGGAPPTDGEADRRALELVDRLRELLCTMGWLPAYRIARVLASEHCRGGGDEGKLRLFKGLSRDGSVTGARWTARLLRDSVYVINRDADAILEAWPFIAWIEPDDKGAGGLYVLKALDATHVRVMNDATGREVRLPLLDDGGDAPARWEEWRESRERSAALQVNEDLGRTLRLPTPSPRLRAGEVIGGTYEVRGLLGEGATGAVYEAWDRARRCSVAVKVLHPELNDDVVVNKRLVQEVGLLKRLQHPRVVAVHNMTAMDDGGRAVVMAHARGGTLAERVIPGGQTADVVRRWACHALEALAFLHQEGVVHRDIKPSNLLVTEDGSVMVGDFGAARDPEATRMTRTVDRIGTRDYWAPEQQAGDEVTPKADLFSLGKSLHELATGRLPKGTPGKGVDGALGTVIRRLCALDAEDRPSALEALAMLTLADERGSRARSVGSDAAMPAEAAPVARGDGLASHDDPPIPTGTTPPAAQRLARAVKPPRPKELTPALLDAMEQRRARRNARLAAVTAQRGAHPPVNRARNTVPTAGASDRPSTPRPPTASRDSAEGAPPRASAPPPPKPRGRLRVHELARELGVLSTELLDRLRARGIDVVGASSYIPDVVAEAYRASTAASGRVRVHELAKELGVASGDLVARMQADGVGVLTASSSIGGDVAAWYRVLLRGGGLRSR